MLKFAVKFDKIVDEIAPYAAVIGMLYILVH